MRSRPGVWYTAEKALNTLRHFFILYPEPDGGSLLTGALDAIRRELEIDGCIGTIHDLFWGQRPPQKEGGGATPDLRGPSGTTY